MSTLLDATNDAAVTQEQPIGTDRLAVIVPVYNEERTVAELLRRLEAQPCVSQIIIVDDGSTDRTWEELEPWRAQASFELTDTDRTSDSMSVIVVQHGKNCGKGRAIRTGLDRVTCSHVIIQDADLEYDPADILKLWEVMQSGTADVVYGSRYFENPQLQKGRFVLQSGVRILNLLTRLFSGVHLTDQATCYKMFRTRDLREMNLCCEKFEFCCEATAKAAVANLRVVEEPISYAPRAVEAGKKLRLSDGIQAIGWLVRMRFCDMSNGSGRFVKASLDLEQTQDMKSLKSKVRWIASTLLLGGVFVAIAACAAMLTYGSLSAASARLNGSLLYIDKPVKRISSVRSGDLLDVSCSVRNLTSSPVTITLLEAGSCGCIEATEIPHTIQAGEGYELAFSVDTYGYDAGTVRRERVRLFTEPIGAPLSVWFEMEMLPDQGDSALESP